MKNQNVLALDLATKTGWAIKHRDGSIKSGVYDSSGKKGSHEGQRFINFRSFLSALIVEHQINHIAYEDIRRHVSTQSAHIHGGFKAIMLMVSAGHNLETSKYGVGTIKKHFTGKGNASKDDMLLKARELGFQPKTDDEADAIAILSLALSEHGIRIGSNNEK